MLGPPSLEPQPACPSRARRSIDTGSTFRTRGTCLALLAAPPHDATQYRGFRAMSAPRLGECAHELPPHPLVWADVPLRRAAVTGSTGDGAREVRRQTDWSIDAS